MKIPSAMEPLKWKLVLFFLLFQPLLIVNSQVINDKLIEDYRWENRLLLIFSPTITNTQFDDMYKAIQRSQPEVDDRDLKIMYLIEKGQSSVEGENINVETANAIREKYVVRDGNVSVILIGKDGGEKLRQRSDFNLNEIFKRIDQMPMRKAELEDRRQDNEE